LTVAQTVSKASVESSCGTRPILARAARKSLMMSWPSASTVPEVGLTMPQMIPIRVVLPPRWTQQGEDLAFVDGEVDVLQRLESRRHRFSTDRLRR